MTEQKRSPSPIEAERWEKIPPYPEFEASTLARIRKAVDGQILKPSKGQGWVRQVMLKGHGVKSLHILVGLAFIGPCPKPAYKIRFHDGNPHNCVPTNLFYGPDIRGSGRHSAVTTKGGAQKIPYQLVIEQTWKELTPMTEKLTGNLKSVAQPPR